MHRREHEDELTVFQSLRIAVEGLHRLSRRHGARRRRQEVDCDPPQRRARRDLSRERSSGPARACGRCPCEIWPAREPAADRIVQAARRERGAEHAGRCLTHGLVDDMENNPGGSLDWLDSF